MNLSDGSSPSTPPAGAAESVYYAIIDQNGRILSMNAAMNLEYGPGTKKQLDYFQSLLSEPDRIIFDTLLTNYDPTLPSLPIDLYTHAGPNRIQIYKWSFFHLVPGKETDGYILCAGHMSDKALDAESVSGMLFKMLEHERLVIGQELHDNVNQLLCSAKLHLDLVQVYQADNQKAKQVTIQLLKEAIEEIKKLSRGMVLQKLPKETLLESVKAFIEDVKTIHKIRILFGIHHFTEDKISDYKKINIYRILQEQFRNVIEHSRAKTVVMTLETDDRHVEMIIDDDGIGFEPDHQVEGIGLINIKERTRNLHGHCEITTSPGKGCRLHISIPL